MRVFEGSLKLFSPPLSLHPFPRSLLVRFAFERKIEKLTEIKGAGRSKWHLSWKRNLQCVSSLYLAILSFCSAADGASFALAAGGGYSRDSNVCVFEEPNQTVSVRGARVGVRSLACQICWEMVPQALP